MLEPICLAIEPLSKDEANRWLDAWTEVYCQRSDGVPDFRWMVFQHECPALRRYKAIETYRQLDLDAVIVLIQQVHDGKATVEGYQLESLQHFEPAGTDMLIFPPSLDWTVAFAHQSGFGPYYSEAQWFEDPT